MIKSSIWPIDGIPSGATTPDQSGPGSDSNEGVIRIPQISSITGASASGFWVSYPGHWLVGGYPSAEIQSLYSTAPADWTSSFGNSEYWSLSCNEETLSSHLKKIITWPSKSNKKRWTLQLYSRSVRDKLPLVGYM